MPPARLFTDMDETVAALNPVLSALFVSVSLKKSIVNISKGFYKK
jgi:hypothetical protein